MGNIPNEEFELTADSLAAHIDTHGGLIFRTLRYFTVNSQDDSPSEEFELTAGTQQAHMKPHGQLILKPHS